MQNISVYFRREKADKVTDLEAIQSKSVLETIMMMAENESGSTLGEIETAVDLLSTEFAGTSNDSLTPLVTCMSPVKVPEEPADNLSESNMKSKKFAFKTSSVSTRLRPQLGGSSLEQQAQGDVRQENFLLRQKQRDGT